MPNNGRVERAAPLPQPTTIRAPAARLDPDEGGAFEKLALRRKALEHRRLVRTLHPFDPLGDLNMRLRRNGIGIVTGCALDVDEAGQCLFVDIEKAGAAVRAEMSPAVF